MDKKTIALVAATMLLAACGRDQESPPPAPPPAPAPADAPAAPPPTTTPPATESQTPPPAGAPMTPSPADPPTAPTTANPQSSGPGTGTTMGDASGTGTASGAAGSSAAGTTDAARGESVFKSACVVCHGPGVAGAPRLDDKADWAPRIGQGVDVLYSHAINGFQGKKGVMPPKGGNMGLSDQDVRAAVDYMVSSVR